jgi:hypothetical protein
MCIICIRKTLLGNCFFRRDALKSNDLFDFFLSIFRFSKNFETFRSVKELENFLIYKMRKLK